MTNRDEQRTLQGSFSTAANGHTSYEIFHASPGIIFGIDRILVSRFGCTPMEPPRIGLDAVITECRKQNIELLSGWDNWSGFYILAQSAEGDELVMEIGSYLNTIIGREEFEKYVHEG